MTSLKTFRKNWVSATTIGFFSLLVMIPISFITLTLFHPPQFEGLTLPEMFSKLASIDLAEFDKNLYIVEQISHIIIYAIAGGILAQLQYKVLKQFIPNRLKWTVITIFGLWVILFGDLVVMGLSTGGVEGPWEPLLIGLGGGGLIALFQYLYLRSVGIKKGTWVVWWILGIITGIVASAIFIFIYEYFLIDRIEQLLSPMLFLVVDWLSFVFPYFTLIGFFVGLFSAKPLYRAIELSKLDKDENEKH